MGIVQIGDFGPSTSFTQFQTPDWIPELETRMFWEQIVNSNANAKNLTIEKKLEVKYDWVMD